MEAELSFRDACPCECFVYVQTGRSKPRMARMDLHVGTNRNYNQFMEGSMASKTFALPRVHIVTTTGIDTRVPFSAPNGMTHGVCSIQRPS